MAVYTEVSDNELQAFLSGYEIGALLSCKGIAEGVQNTNFLLHTDKGQYILTLYENMVEEDDLPFFLGLMEHLAVNGISCPLPVHDRQGKALGRLAGRPAVIVSFLEGYSISRPLPAHCRELGRALASLHLAGEDFSLSRKNALGPEGWRHMARGMMKELAAIRLDGTDPAHIIKSIDQALANINENWPAPGSLPEGIIHADLFPDNVFFIGDKLSGLIDFYFACNDFLAYDLAVCLNAWCFERDGGFNSTSGRALLAGYEEKRKLSGEEKQALPLLAEGAALRFLLTRLAAWLESHQGALVKRHDPRDFLRRLRFHQKIADFSQYGIGA